jgi:regulator of protease activity HflC (stomatin/prohibitin superfamily)
LSLVYFKIKDDILSVLKFRYEHGKYYEWRIINLAQKILRSVIGNTSFTSLQPCIGLINKELRIKMFDEALKMGINIVRTDIKEMDLQPDKQEIISAGNNKEFAEDNFHSTAKTCTE